MKAIHTEFAPVAIGTYSQAIQAGNTVYLSGQIPLVPATMQLCSDDIQLQIEQVFDNLEAVVKAVGGSLSQIVKLTVYLTDLTDFSWINESMSKRFTQPYPARVALGVNALPKASRVEIDAVMVLM
jgi:reactive intermediate/imine deaminase